MDLISMVERVGVDLVVRSIITGELRYVLKDGARMKYTVRNESVTHTLLHSTASVQEPGTATQSFNIAAFQQVAQSTDDDFLPQSRIKRNYSCSYCPYFTQNSRSHLKHLRDVHKQKMTIHECVCCVYASQHAQKLVRHMTMVHGYKNYVPPSSRRRVRRVIPYQQEHNRDEQKPEEKRDNGNAVMDLGIGPRVDATTPDVKFDTQQTQLPQTDSNRNTSNSSFGGCHNNIRLPPAIQHLGPTTNQKTELPPFKQNVASSVNTGRDRSMGSSLNLENGSGPSGEEMEQKLFRCSKCHFETTHIERLNRHMRYHEMPTIKCLICDFRTPYKWNLDRHMKSHGGAGTFKCSMCDFKAVIKQALTVHEQKHHVPPVANDAQMQLHTFNQMRRP